MIFKAFSITDSAAETYNLPMFVPTAGVAIRSFEDQCKDPESMLNKHPHDYMLCEIGEFDSDKGILISLEIPHAIAKASDYVKRSKK